MNRTTKDIMEWFKIEADEALKVQQRMMENGLDFSECTDRQMKKAAKQARTEILLGGSR